MNLRWSSWPKLTSLRPSIKSNKSAWGSFRSRALMKPCMLWKQDNSRSWSAKSQTLTNHQHTNMGSIVSWRIKIIMMITSPQTSLFSKTCRLRQSIPSKRSNQAPSCSEKSLRRTSCRNKKLWKRSRKWWEPLKKYLTIWNRKLMNSSSFSWTLMESKKSWSSSWSLKG